MVGNKLTTCSATTENHRRLKELRATDRQGKDKQLYNVDEVMDKAPNQSQKSFRIIVTCIGEKQYFPLGA